MSKKRKVKSKNSPANVQLRPALNTSIVKRLYYCLPFRHWIKSED